jgi:hypothetical protein
LPICSRSPRRNAGTRSSTACSSRRKGRRLVTAGPRRDSLGGSVDPIEEMLAVYRWHVDGYVEVLVANRNERVRAEPFNAIEFRVGTLFGENKDEDDEDKDEDDEDKDDNDT